MGGLRGKGGEGGGGSGRAARPVVQWPHAAAGGWQSAGALPASLGLHLLPAHDHCPVARVLLNAQVHAVVSQLRGKKGGCF